MALYKTENNELHDDMDGKATQIILARHPTAILISQAEADAILNPPPNLAVVKSAVMSQIRSQRLPVFSALDIMRQDELVIIATSTNQVDIDASKLNVTAIQNFIQGLRDATLIDLSAYSTETEMLLAITNYYKALVAAAPTALKPRFKAAMATK
jgi:hypothetical protein